MSKSQRYAKHRNIKSKVRLKEDCKQLLEWYRSRQSSEQFEPRWMHPSFQCLAEFMDGDVSNIEYVKMIVHSHETPDFTTINSFPFGTRIVHDGVKITTTSWIFFGRNDPVKIYRYLNTDWIVLGRKIPEKAMNIFIEHAGLETVPDTVWMAYHLDHPMGESSLTGEEIGPCNSEEEVLSCLAEGTTPTIAIVLSHKGAEILMGSSPIV